MQTTITKSFNFEAAHQFDGYNEKCAKLHGHSYRFEVTISGPVITNGNYEGMIIDFLEVSRIVDKEIISQWDHTLLNTVVSFRPTAELLAAEIFKRLKKAGLSISKVRLWETEKSSATVTE
jgi:6-pyruvoyltetrahydropterin/6-carboxytetrahydropterin synthase